MSKNTLVRITETIELTIFGETAELDLEIEGNITPYRPQTGPRYNCGGEPEEPSEVEDLNVGFYYTDWHKAKLFVSLNEHLSEKQIEACEEKLLEQYESEK